MFLQFSIFLHAEEANCESDKKWTNQNYPSQECFTSAATSNKLLYVFPVSWLSGQRGSKEKREYQKFSSLSKYSLTPKKIYENAIKYQMTGDWNQVSYPARANQFQDPSDVYPISFVC
jgi:hypothetical protein